ncbi:MAG: PelD GGDEF domain-containing protein, partial [Burkholderiaceae bacterium]
RSLFPRRRADGAEAPTLAWMLLETLLFCGGALLLGFWADAADPFGLRLQFPWLWIMPALLAMRYGTGIGVVAVALLILAWVGLPRAGMADGMLPNFPKVYFLGGLVLVLVCGQFADIWNARSRRLRAINAYLDERLNTLTKNHFLLRLSHERLEQDLLAKPLTLRETLVRLRGLTGTAGTGEALPGAREFLQLLGQSCQLEIAAVHAFDHAGRPMPQPAAQLGLPAPLDADDPLYRFALAENMLAHVQTESVAVEARDASRYLICAPLQPSSGATLGMLVVEKLPFFALNHDTLQLLSVLAGYYSDGIRMSELTAAIRRRLPACPPELALDITRLHRIRASAGIETSLVALVVENEDAALGMFEQLKRLKRGVDLSWELAGPDRSALITLLPLAGSAAVEGYLLRIEAALQSQFGTDFLEGRMASHVVHLGVAPPADALASLVERCAL